MARTGRARWWAAAMLAACAASACGGGAGKSATATARPASATAGAAATAATATTPAPLTATVVVAPATPASASATGAAPPAPAAATPTSDPPVRADAAAAMCATAAETAPGTVASPDLVEVSGLAYSRRNGGVVWAHNDSGDTARVFAMDAQGGALATYTLADAEAIDWEDMASAPDTSRGGAELYLADIGDNARARPEIVVYRVLEPAVNPAAAPIAATLSNVEKLTLRYPDGPHDAETLMVDPRNGDLIIITKDAAGSQVFRAPGILNADGAVTLQLVGRIDFSQLRRRTEFPPDAPPLARAGGAFATGGDISPAGDVIAVRTYAAVWLWSRAPGQSIGDALAAAPCEAASAAEAQGEAFAFDADGRGYVTASEGVHPPLHHFRAN